MSVSRRQFLGSSAALPFGGMVPLQSTSASELERLRGEWIGLASPTRGLVELGRAVRGPMYTDAKIYGPEVRAARELNLPVTMHAGITPGRTISAVELHRRGFLDEYHRREGDGFERGADGGGRHRAGHVGAGGERGHGDDGWTSPQTRRQARRHRHRGDRRACGPIVARRFDPRRRRVYAGKIDLWRPR